MSGFTAEWLALREPVDAAARNAEVTAAVQTWRQRHGPLTVLDLACGAGTNVRFLAPLLGGEQHAERHRAGLFPSLVRDPRIARIIRGDLDE